MKQSVNLLSDELLGRLPRLNLYVMAALLTLELLGLSIAVVAQTQHVNSLQSAYLQIQGDYDDRALEFEQLETEAVPIAKDPRLNQDIERLQREKFGKEKVLALLDPSKVVRNTQPSAILRAIAEHSITGLWLDDIRIQPERQHLQLHGKTTAAEHITRYLAALSQSDTFYGVEFSSLNVLRDDKPPHRLSFQLNSEFVGRQ